MKYFTYIFIKGLRQQMEQFHWAVSCQVLCKHSRSAEGCIDMVQLKAYSRGDAKLLISKAYNIFENRDWNC